MSNTPRTTLMELFRSVRHNRPFQRFIAAYLIAGTGYGFFVALVYPFISSYLQIGEEDKARRWLSKAEEVAEDDSLKRNYHNKLELLLSASPENQADL